MAKKKDGESSALTSVGTGGIKATLPETGKALDRLISFEINRWAEIREKKFDTNLSSHIEAISKKINLKNKINSENIQEIEDVFSELGKIDPDKSKEVSSAWYAVLVEILNKSNEVNQLIFDLKNSPPSAISELHKLVVFSNNYNYKYLTKVINENKKIDLNELIDGKIIEKNISNGILKIIFVNIIFITFSYSIFKSRLINLAKDEFGGFLGEKNFQTIEEIKENAVEYIFVYTIILIFLLAVRFLRGRLFEYSFTSKGSRVARAIQRMIEQSP